MVLTPERRRRRDACKMFLAATGSMPAAIAEAKKRGFSANTSVWIGALCEILEEKRRPGTGRRRGGE